MTKPDWGQRYICYKCHARFYNLNKPAAICPKCGVDQAKAPPKLSSSSPPRIRPPRALVPEEADVEERADDEFGEMGEIGLDEIEPTEGEEEI